MAKVIKKEKMIKSISFKENQRTLWEHLMSQIEPTAYIKYLILKDMQEIDEEPLVQKNEIQNSNINVNSSSDNYLDLDF